MRESIYNTCRRSSASVYDAATDNPKLNPDRERERRGLLARTANRECSHWVFAFPQANITHTHIQQHAAVNPKFTVPDYYIHVLLSITLFILK